MESQFKSKLRSPWAPQKRDTSTLVYKVRVILMMLALAAIVYTRLKLNN